MDSSPPPARTAAPGNPGPSGKLACIMDAPLSQSMDSVNTVATGEDEVRTLFVSGLPMDTKPRELYLLFRAYEGYEGSLLKVTSKNGKTASPVGFVTFHTRAGAEAAKQDLQVIALFSQASARRSRWGKGGRVSYRNLRVDARLI